MIPVARIRSAMTDQPPISKTLASIYRKEIATGKGNIGHAGNKTLKTLSPEMIAQRKQKLAEYDSYMARHGQTRVRKWATQLQTTTHAIKKDTTQILHNTTTLNACTAATHEEVQQLRKEVREYTNKVQANTQPNPDQIAMAARLSSPMTAVKVLNSIFEG